MPTIERINVTPMKGSLVHHPERAELTDRGIAHDRLFYLVDEWGEIFSGSTFGPLVRLRASFDAEAERLRIAFPDGTEVTGPANTLGASHTTNFYGRPVAAREVDGPFSEALSAFCSKPLQLMRCEREGDGIDVEPITLVSTASVRDLAERGRYEGELDARRFRMTFDIAGCEPYEEESWAGRAIQIGDAVIEIGGQVPRCLFTTKDPDSGEKDWSTLTEIAKYRPRIAGDGGLPFGVYARVARPATIRTGDALLPLPG